MIDENKKTVRGAWLLRPAKTRTYFKKCSICYRPLVACKINSKRWQENGCFAVVLGELLSPKRPNDYKLGSE